MEVYSPTFACEIGRKPARALELPGTLCARSSRFPRRPLLGDSVNKKCGTNLTNSLAARETITSRISKPTCTIPPVSVNKRQGKPRMEKMHWYNPTIRTMEDTNVPMNDEQAIDKLSHNENSDEFIAHYRDWRVLGSSREEALLLTGEHYRAVHAGRTPPL
jgi:hypothetical protein